MKCPNCGKPLKKYPCGYGNPNDVGGCGCSRGVLAAPVIEHQNCYCVIFPSDRNKEKVTE